MWKAVLITAVFCCLLGSIGCPPVKPEKAKKQGAERSEEMKLGLQYERYLKEVVSVLEEDEGFKKKLEDTNVTDIKKQRLSYQRYLEQVFGLMAGDQPEFIASILRDPKDPVKGLKLMQESGDIAKHLDLVSHNVRTKLDELKRREVDRLNQIKKLMEHKMKIEQGEVLGKRGHMPGLGQGIPNMSAKVVEAMLKAQGVDDPKKATDHHIDFNNPETFEVEDLKKLIVQATNDLEKVNQARKKEFKTYEMTKEHMRREKLKMMSERERKEAEAKQAEMKRMHNDHPKLHHPGSKDQLEEVWEETDGLDKEDFDPKTFFRLHDHNTDGFLDFEEVEALFVKELDKVYDPEHAEDDLVEREEEMNRMREHVYKEVDVNQDGVISEKEFIDSTKREDFDKDEPWGAIEEDDEFTDDEFNDFEEHLNMEEFDHVQPGEINIPHQQPSEIPKINDDLHLNLQGQDHLGEGHGGNQGVVDHMRQQQGQGVPVVQDVNQQQPPANQQHQQQADPNQQQHQQQQDINQQQHQQQPDPNQQPADGNQQQHQQQQDPNQQQHQKPADPNQQQQEQHQQQQANNPPSPPHQ